jgi:hypothetical protein
VTARTVIFLHLPKAAGSTLNRVIAQQYTPEAIYQVGGKAPELRARELAAGTAPPAKIRLVTGHLPFGVHREVHSDFTYITMLREPVERMISHYHYARKLAKHPLHADIVSGRLTLREAARQLANHQTRYLADQEVRATPETVGRDALESAKENLARHFAVAGLTERFEETLILLQRELGWKVRPVASSNVTRERPSRSACSEDDLAAIRAVNPLDLELYDWARSRFEAEIARAGATFRTRVAWLRLRNRALHFGRRMIFPRATAA